MPWSPGARGLAALALISLAAGCAPAVATPRVAAGKCAPLTTTPPTRGWRTNCPEAVGLDTAVLRQGIAYLARYPASVSLLVARRGQLVTEHYFRGANARTAFDAGSITKAVLASLIGIALHEGRLPPIDGPFVDCFAGARTDSTLDAWRGVTMHHLLTMRAGYDNDSLGPSRLGTMAGLLRRPLAAPPGTRGAYDHGSYHLAGACLWTKVRSTLVPYANDVLFGPMGEWIGYYDWDGDEQDIEWGHTGLVLRPRTIAKFGLLLARRGMWGERVVVPPTWVDATTSPAGPAGDDGAAATFAYGWWRQLLGGERLFYAEGTGGQLLAVFPELDLVVVVTSDPRIPGGIGRYDRLLESFVLGAVRDRPAPPSR